MDLLRQARRSAGIDGATRGGALIERADLTDDSQKAKGPAVSVSELIEPLAARMITEGETQRPATLRCGELVPYALEEIAATKETEFAYGRAVHLYRGTLRAGTTLREGAGWLFLATGETYCGRWRGNMRHGPGMLTHPDGYSYEGAFREDKPNGVGRESFPNGDVYIGDFVAGKPHGRGIMYYADAGSRYEGHFSQGRKHGAGVVLYENGDSFEGTWIDGAREGRGITTYAPTNLQRNSRPASICHSYASTWEASSIPHLSLISFAGDVDTGRHERRLQGALAAGAPAEWGAPSPQGLHPLPPDMRTMSEFPDQLADIHPAYFARIKRAFEACDVECVGEVDLAFLNSQWKFSAQSQLSAGGLPVDEPLDALPEKTSRRGGGSAEDDEFGEAADDPQSSGRRDIKTVTGSTKSVLEQLHRAAQRNGVSIDLLEYLGVIFPHLAAADVKRWLVVDPTPEALLRLRGSLAGVTSSKNDGFYNMSGGRPLLTVTQLQQWKGCVGGVRVPQASLSRLQAMQLWKSTQAAATSAKKTSPIVNPTAPVAAAAALPGAAASAALAGHHHGHHHASAAHYFTYHPFLSAPQNVSAQPPTSTSHASVPRGGNPDTPGSQPEASFAISFPQLYSLLFPNTSPSQATRVEIDTIPALVLRRYASAFDALDDMGVTGYVSLEKLKSAQRQYQTTVSCRLDWKATVATLRKQAVSGAAGDPSHASNAYLSRLEPGVFQQAPRWMIGDIALTVALAKAIDRQRTGFVSLVELLRYAYPNVPCLATKERLGVTVRAEDACKCCLCAFCGPRYVKPRPPNPYVDGSLSW